MGRRYEALDGLRGVAAVAVVAHHMFTWWSPTDYRYAHSPQGLVFTHLLPSFRGAFLCVDLFFILSGFVIASAYRDRINSSADTYTFVIRRFFRVYPMHFAVLIVMACAAVLSFGALEFQDEYEASNFFSGLLFLNGWLRSAPATWNAPSWSISCEFVAYFLFAGAAWSGCLRSRMVGRIAAALGAVGYIALVIRYGEVGVLNHAAVVRAVAGFAIGMWLQQEAQPIRTIFVFGYAEIVVAGGLIGSTLLPDGPLALAFIAIAAALVAFLQSDAGPVARVLRTRMAQFLGEISYSIYIIHWPVLILTTAILRTEGIVISNYWLGDLFALAMGGSIVGLAFLTYALIELPWREFGRGITVSDTVAKA